MDRPLQAAVPALTIREIPRSSAFVCPPPKTYRGSYYQMTHRSTVLAGFRRREGILGEAWAGDEEPNPRRRSAPSSATTLAPRLKGLDALRVEQCWEAMRSRPPTSCATASWRCAPGLRRQRLWDAVGKALDAPLYKLWGGYAAELPVICIAGYYEEGKTLADFGREMEQIRADGYAGCKFKVGGRTPKEDAERVRAARAAAGDDFVLCVDANQGWSLRQAVEFSPAVPRTRTSAGSRSRCTGRTTGSTWPRRATMTGIPVCAGQSEISRAGCRDLMMAGAIDVCNFDASWGGGPTEWRRVAALAAVLRGRDGPSRGAADLRASARLDPPRHLSRNLPPDRDPIWWNLPANRPKLRDGILELSNWPGLGWEIDEAFLKRYRIAV